MTGLERSYRRLLLWYPAAYRRSHGDELVTTLLDAAGSARRPSRRDVYDLVRGGLRQRFRLPVGKGSVAAAVFFALLSGALGAGVGSFLGWCTVPALHADAADSRAVVPRAVVPRAVVSLAVGGPYLGGFSRDDRWQHRADPLVAVDPRYVPGWSSAAAADRFTAEGWTVRPVGESAFIAQRGRVEARISGPLPASDPAPDPSAGPVDVTIWLATPAAASSGTVLGWLLGAAAGWLLTAWVFQALRGSRSWSRRGAVLVLVLASLLVLLRPALVTYLLLGAAVAFDVDAWGAPPPVHIGVVDSDAPAVPLLGLAAIAVACLVAGIRRATPAPTSDPAIPT